MTTAYAQDPEKDASGAAGPIQPCSPEADGQTVSEQQSSLDKTHEQSEAVRSHEVAHDESIVRLPIPSRALALIRGSLLAGRAPRARVRGYQP